MAPYGAKTESLFQVMTPAVWAMSPRFLLLFFLVLAHTYGVSLRSDYDSNETYYMNGNIRCLRCPPGTFVLTPCSIQNTESICAPCHPGLTYSEHPTGVNTCLKCTVCRTDQDEVSPCTVTKNSVCQCKEGTYCPPDEPCEICQKCTTSCLPDQVIQTPCNSTSDTQCAPPESASNTPIVVVSVVVPCILLLALICAWLFCRKKKNCDVSKWTPKILTVSLNCDEAAAKDIEIPFLPQRPKLHFKENITENEKNEAINKTFNIFVDRVPTKVFDKFVRELGLTENQIDWAKEDNRGTYNKHYAMLTQLYQDKKFDVNIWLNKLHAIKMGKVAEDITEEFIKDRLFERSAQ